MKNISMASLNLPQIPEEPLPVSGEINVHLVDQALVSCHWEAYLRSVARITDHPNMTLAADRH